MSTNFSKEEDFELVIEANSNAQFFLEIASLEFPGALKSYILESRVTIDKTAFQSH